MRVADNVLLGFITIGDMDPSQPDTYITESVLYNFYGKSDAASPTCDLSTKQLNNNYKKHLEVEDAYRKSETYKEMGQQSTNLHPTTVALANCVLECLFIEESSKANDLLNNPAHTTKLFKQVYAYIHSKITKSK